MMKQLKMTGLLILAAGAAGGCAQTEEWTLTGTIDQTTFPATITVVALVQGDVTLAEAQPSADGSFTLTVSTGAGYHVELITDETTLPLVIPRLAAPDSSNMGGFELDISFGVPEDTDWIDLHGFIEGIETLLGDESEPPNHFELGTVRYLPDPFGTQYISSQDASESCVDGVDPIWGARCIDPGAAGIPACLEEVTDTAYTEAEPLDSSVTAGALADRSIPLALCGGGGDGDGRSEPHDEGDRH